MDRQVRQVAPSEGERESAFFSSLANVPNIVLLGEPGAGKTTLFRYHADLLGGRYLSVRSFLNASVEVLSQTRCLFLDALDEKRTGRSDQSIVDSVVEKLLRVDPDQVRISCRAADWLGDSDLAALNDYFGANGGISVFALDPLTYEEQQDVLMSRGLADAAGFIAEARSRALDELLGNPQNLIMLLDAVRNGGWPSSKRDLFEKSCDLLLTEHNAAHSERQTGKFTAEELFDAAGGVFAIRLIGDADGICAGSTSLSEDCPSYRQLPVDDVERVQACLSRRAFVQIDGPSVFDYAHRTVAEYLAARWLAQRFRQGLSIARLLSLIGVESKPASELRGLYAWLPVLIPEAAQTFISGDPFGVLSYGDAASLTPSARKLLLAALGSLAKDDPWFRHNQWRKAVAWGLAGEDLVPEFSAILADEKADFSLRSLVLDALSFGTPLRRLAPLLEKVLFNRKCAYSEREDAILLLSQWEPADSPRIFSSLGGSPDDLRLKVALLDRLPPSWVGAHDFAALVNQVLRLPRRSAAIGSYWMLSEAVPDQYIDTVLSAVRPPRRRKPGGHGDRAEGVGIVERLIVRALLPDRACSPGAVLQWLMMRHRLAERFGSTSAEKVRAALGARAELLEALPAEIVRYIDMSHAGESAWWQIPVATFGCVECQELIKAGLVALEERSACDRKSVYAFILAFAGRIDNLPSRSLDRIVLLGQENALKGMWRSYRVAEIPEWRFRRFDRESLRREEQAQTHSEMLRQFDEAADLIASGAHNGWLLWLGKLYCGRLAEFRGVTPTERVIAALGASRAAIAAEGLQALARNRAPLFDDVMTLQARGEYRPSWFAFLAGLDLIVAADSAYWEVSSETIEVALAIDTFHSSFNESEGSHSIIQWNWRAIAESQQPYLVANVLINISKVAVERGSNHIDGLHALVETANLSSQRPRALRCLLAEYPDCSIYLLRTALPAFASGPLDPRNSRVAWESYEACIAAGMLEHANWWFGYGLIIAPDRFGPLWVKHEPSKALLWALEGLEAHNRYPFDTETQYLGRLMQIGVYGLKAFPMAAHPSGGWCGSTNPWDASDYVKKLFAEIAASANDRVQPFLRSQLATAELQGYGDYLKHLLAEHGRRRIDSRYVQPNWRETRDSLLNLIPRDAAELSALAVDELTDFIRQLAGSNVDIFKRFWNEDSYGRITEPKSEESARDVLLDFIRPRVAPLDIAVEPEGHMANDKRADIVLIRGGIKAVVELKRDYHAELWTAAQHQLDRFYTRDPGAGGYGIYGVFWYGEKRPRSMPAAPFSMPLITSSVQLKSALESLLPEDCRPRIRVVVFDVSGSS